MPTSTTWARKIFAVSITPTRVSGGAETFINAVSLKTVSLGSQCSIVITSSNLKVAFQFDQECVHLLEQQLSFGIDSD